MMSRHGLAAATWWAEMACVLSTILCTIITLDDSYHGKAIITDKAWFKEGFCIWRGPIGADSHILCFIADNLFGGWLVYVNYKLWKKHKSSALLIAGVVSLFDVAHGWGHLMMHFFPIPQVRPHLTFIELFVLWIGASAFLAIGPIVGYEFGVSKVSCIIIHEVSMALFVLYMPPLFSFGAVQLVINFWYCCPRILWFGCSGEDAIHKRVDDGYAAASIGIALVMPVVFAEMLECQAFYRAILGHFQYDFSLLILTFAFSACIWSSLPEEPLEENLADSTHDAVACKHTKFSPSKAVLQVLDSIDGCIIALQDLLSFAAHCVSLARHCVKHGIPTFTDDGSLCDRGHLQPTIGAGDSRNASPSAEAVTVMTTSESSTHCRKRSLAHEVKHEERDDPKERVLEEEEKAVAMKGSDGHVDQREDAANARDTSSGIESSQINSKWEIVFPE